MTGEPDTRVVPPNTFNPYARPNAVTEIRDDHTAFLGKVYRAFAGIAFGQVEHVGRIMHRHGCMGARTELIHQPLCCGHLDHAFPDYAPLWAHPPDIIPYTCWFEKKKISGTANNHSSGDNNY